MNPQEFLASHWVFTREELASALGQRGERSGRTVSSHLTRWQRMERIQKVKAGLYVRSDQSSPDLLPIAAKATPDSVLAYHTALEAHGVAQSLFETLTFATWTKAKPFRFLGRLFSPTQPRIALARAGKSRTQVESLDRSGVEIRVTSLERTVVDVLDRIELAGGADEVWRSCLAVRALGLRELQGYLELLDRRGLTAKVGYFLETHADQLHVPGTVIERLRKKRPSSPMSVDRRTGGRLVRRWNLVIPRAWFHESTGARE